MKYLAIVIIFSALLSGFNSRFVLAEEAKPISSPHPAAPSSTGAAPSSGEEGDYEIDYEEEVSGDQEESEPVKKAPSKKKSAANSVGGAGGIQGSRAKHRFIPILKSETKSIYKKDGKALDVDTD